MRLLCLANNVRGDNGWGRHADSVITALQTQGVVCEVLTEANRSDSESASSTTRSWLLAPVSLKNILINLFVVRKAATRVDIVHAFDGWPYGFYALVATIATGKRFYVTGVGTYTTAPLEVGGLKGWILRWVYRRASGVLCISRYTKKRVHRSMPMLKNLHLVPLGASPIVALSAQERRWFEQRFLVAGGHPILVTVGQIKHRKGQRDTVRAVRLLREKYPNILYCIVGSDHDQAYVQGIQADIADAGLEKNVRIIANATGDQALSFFYSIADVFVMNSNNDGTHYEGFGLVFLEAMQFGLPVVGSRDCGIEDAIEDGYNGYRTRQGDVTDIADKIDRVLQGDKRVWSEHAQEFASRFSWSKTAEAHLIAYTEH